MGFSRTDLSTLRILPIFKVHEENKQTFIFKYFPLLKCRLAYIWGCKRIILLTLFMDFGKDKVDVNRFVRNRVFLQNNTYSNMMSDFLLLFLPSAILITFCIDVIFSPETIAFCIFNELLCRKLYSIR